MYAIKIAGLIILAFLLDFLLGDPRWLPHPVVLMGKLISCLEARLRPAFGMSEQGLFRAGLCLVVIVCLAAFLVPFIALKILYTIHFVLGFAVELLWCWQCLSARSLHTECRHVYRRLVARPFDMSAARRAVGRIVGRDVQNLSELQIINAAVETAAENTTDGVVSPLIFMAIGGAPFALLYKAVNTMDSMLGYRNERYRFFGKAAARLDDAMNFMPARVAALLMIGASAFAGCDARRAANVFLRDRKKHDSPNAGQTESVMAGALGIQLGGSASYDGRLEPRPLLGDHLRPPRAGDIRLAAKIMYITSLLCALVCAATMAAFA